MKTIKADEIYEVDSAIVLSFRNGCLSAGCSLVSVLGWLNAVMIHGGIR